MTYRAAAIGLAAGLLSVLAGAPAWAGSGEGYFYAQGPRAIPDGHGNASLPLHSVLPGDIDPKIDYVSVSLRIRHPRTHDLVINLKRPDFDYTGPDPAQPTERLVTLSDRDTRGRNLGRGQCPAVSPMAAPAGFTTFNDFGGPPLAMAGSPSPPLSGGSPPFPGTFAPTEPLAGFTNYHHAPSTDPASPETWRLNVRDVRPGKAGAILCAVLYLHRI